MTLKIYPKVRIEVIVHNTKAYRWGRSLRLPEIVVRLQNILERLLNAVLCIDACFVSDDTLETLPQAGTSGTNQGRWNRSQSARMRPAAAAVLALSTSPAGFTASDLAQKVRALSGQPEAELERGAPPMKSRSFAARACCGSTESPTARVSCLM